MSGKLSTHVLDTMHGIPAAGVKIELHRITDGEAEIIKATTTNADGRTDAPLLIGEAMKPGKYRLVFFIHSYFKKQKILVLMMIHRMMKLIPLFFLIQY